MVKRILCKIADALSGYDLNSAFYTTIVLRPIYIVAKQNICAHIVIEQRVYVNL